MHGRHDQPYAVDVAAHRIGHNHSDQGPVQWQTPHNHDHAHEHHLPRSDEFRDLDLVERAFIQGFANATDPTSFLRLAGVAFSGVSGDGSVLRLLRVEQNQTTDIGSVTPHLGGESFRYDPLPAKLVSQRDRLALVYFDGHATVRLNLAEAQALEPLVSEGEFVPGSPPEGLPGANAE